jgi:hypothetical protein
VDNTDQVLQTLKLCVGILNRNKIQYRFLGSIISSTLNSGIHRHLNDLDILIDEHKREIFASELLKLGFVKKTKTFLRLSEQLNLHIYTHPRYLEISFYGIYFKSGGGGELNYGHIRADINSLALKKTAYFLSGINFIGVPASVVYKSILYSKSNPKRIDEIRIFDNNKILPFSGELFNLYFYGLNISWVPRLANYTLEIIGSLRMLFGLKYDIWK